MPARGQLPHRHPPSDLTSGIWSVPLPELTNLTFSPARKTLSPKVHHVFHPSPCVRIRQWATSVHRSYFQIQSLLRLPTFTLVLNPLSQTFNSCPNLHPWQPWSDIIMWPNDPRAMRNKARLKRNHCIKFSWKKLEETNRTCIPYHISVFHDA